jgi:hypothetical protein
VATATTKKTREFSRDFRGIVDAVKQRVFKRDTAASRVEVTLCGRHEIRDRGRARGGHQPLTKCIVRRMQGDRETYLELLGRQAVDGMNQSHG